jgi:hypothetical protein
MKENYVVFPVHFTGTVAQAGGSAYYPTPIGLTFKAVSIACPTSGGSVKVTSVDTGQGTATASLGTAGGSVYIGTAATGAGTSLIIPNNGTVCILGTAFGAAGTPSQLSALVYFTLNEA